MSKLPFGETKESSYQPKASQTVQILTDAQYNLWQHTKPEKSYAVLPFHRRKTSESVRTNKERILANPTFYGLGTWAWNLNLQFAHCRTSSLYKMWTVVLSSLRFQIAKGKIINLQMYCTSRTSNLFHPPRTILSRVWNQKKLHQLADKLHQELAHYQILSIHISADKRPTRWFSSVSLHLLLRITNRFKH